MLFQKSLFIPTEGVREGTYVIDIDERVGLRPGTNVIDMDERERGGFVDHGVFRVWKV